MKDLFLIAIALVSLIACQNDNHKSETDITDTDASVEKVSATETGFNQLTAEEENAGWVLLFDGETTAGWHNFQQETVSGWKVVDGMLMTEGGNGDIVTNNTYDNFELVFEWKVAPEGNSGVMYLVQEDEAYDHTHQTGPEYQIIDDENYPGELTDDQKSGANYALHAPGTAAANPAGEFNTGKIILNEGVVSHWLNGEKVVEYELWTEEWEEILSKTKFAAMPGYGQSKSGHIALQDHGDEVAFRNIKIKAL